jgi:hypothetical protein
MPSMLVSRLAICQLFVFLASQARAGQSEQVSWEFLQQANRAARDSIRTLSCRVELTNVTSEPQGGAKKILRREFKEIGVYYCSPEAVRVKILELTLPGGGKQDAEYLWQNGIRKGRTRQTQSTHAHTSYAIDALSERYWNFSDPLSCSPFSGPCGMRV